MYYKMRKNVVHVKKTEHFMVKVDVNQALT